VSTNNLLLKEMTKEAGVSFKTVSNVINKTKFANKEKKSKYSSNTKTEL